MKEGRGREGIAGLPGRNRRNKRARRASYGWEMSSMYSPPPEHAGLEATDTGLLAAVVAGQARLTREQGFSLLRGMPLTGLGRWADARCRAIHGDQVRTYVIDRNINYTNVCTARCTFCAFRRDGDESFPEPAAISFGHGNWAGFDCPGAFAGPPGIAGDGHFHQGTNPADSRAGKAVCATASAFHGPGKECVGDLLQRSMQPVGHF